MFLVGAQAAKSFKQASRCQKRTMKELNVTYEAIYTNMVMIKSLRNNMESLRHVG